MSRNKFGLLICLFIPIALIAQQTLKVDVDLVNVFVTVQDAKGDYFTDLGRDDFVLYDDDKVQKVSVFENQGNVRSSIGMLLDISGSMVDIIPYMNRGVRDFSKAVGRPDDLTVITFGTDVKLIHRSPDSQEHLDKALQALKPWGTSVLFDAMLYGMERIGQNVNERKALIVFTDGNDNGSHGDFNSVIHEAQLSGVVLYFVAIGSPVLVDKHTVDSLAGTSGGRVFYVPKTEAVLPFLEKIRSEMAKQYYLGYYVTRQPGYHHLRVEIPGRPNLQVHTRAGYIGN